MITMPPPSSWHQRRAIRHIIAGDLAVAHLQAAVAHLNMAAIVVDMGMMQYQIATFAGQHRATRAAATQLGVLQRNIAA